MRSYKIKQGQRLPLESNTVLNDILPQALSNYDERRSELLIMKMQKKEQYENKHDVFIDIPASQNEIVVIVTQKSDSYEVHVIHNAVIRPAILQETSKISPGSIKPIDFIPDSPGKTKIAYIANEEVGVLMDMDEFYPTQIIVGGRTIPDVPSRVVSPHSYEVVYMRNARIDYSTDPSPVVMIMRDLVVRPDDTPIKSLVRVYIKEKMKLNVYDLDKIKSSTPIDLFMQSVWRDSYALLESDSVNLFFSDRHLYDTITNKADSSLTNKLSQTSDYIPAPSEKDKYYCCRCATVSGRSFILNPRTPYNRVSSSDFDTDFIPPSEIEIDRMPLAFEDEIYKSNRKKYKAITRLQESIVIVESVKLSYESPDPVPADQPLSPIVVSDETPSSPSVITIDTNIKRTREESDDSEDPKNADSSNDGSGVDRIPKRPKVTKNGSEEGMDPVIFPSETTSLPEIGNAEFSTLSKNKSHALVWLIQSYGMNKYLIHSIKDKISYVRYSPPMQEGIEPKKEDPDFKLDPLRTKEEKKNWILGIPYTMWLDASKIERVKDEFDSLIGTDIPYPPGSLIKAHISLFLVEQDTSTKYLYHYTDLSRLITYDNQAFRLQFKRQDKLIVDRAVAVFSLYDAADKLIGHGHIVGKERSSISNKEIIDSVLDDQTTYHVSGPRNNYVDEDPAFDKAVKPTKHPVFDLIKNRFMPYVKASDALMYLDVYKRYIGFKKMTVSDNYVVDVSGIDCLYGLETDYAFKRACQEMNTDSIDLSNRSDMYASKEELLKTIIVTFSVLWGMGSVVQLKGVDNPVKHLEIISSVYLNKDKTNYRFVFNCFYYMLQYMNKENFLTVVKSLFDIDASTQRFSFIQSPETYKNKVKQNITAATNYVQWFGENYIDEEKTYMIINYLAIQPSTDIKDQLLGAWTKAYSKIKSS